MHSQITTCNTPSGSSSLAQHQPMTRHVMSSREIADLTGKRHDHVMRDIRRMLTELEITDPKFGGSYQDDTGRALPCFFLDRDLTETLITGYNVKFRHRVIKRLRQLEQQQATPYAIPTNLADALRLAADKAEENERLIGVIQLQAPKVAALQRLAKTPGSVSLTDAAKHLGMGPLKLIAWLHANRWIYRRTPSANWSAYQPRITGGLLEHKMVRVNRNETEELKIVEQVMVTRRGLVVLAEKVTGLSPAGKV